MMILHALSSIRSGSRADLPTIAGRINANVRSIKRFAFLARFPVVARGINRLSVSGLSAHPSFLRRAEGLPLQQRKVVIVSGGFRSLSLRQPNVCRTQNLAEGHPRPQPFWGAKILRAAHVVSPSSQHWLGTFFKGEKNEPC